MSDLNISGTVPEALAAIVRAFNELRADLDAVRTVRAVRLINSPGEFAPTTLDSDPTQVKAAELLFADATAIDTGLVPGSVSVVLTQNDLAAITDQHRFHLVNAVPDCVLSLQKVVMAYLKGDNAFPVNAIDLFVVNEASVITGAAYLTEGLTYVPGVGNITDTELLGGSASGVQEPSVASGGEIYDPATYKNKAITLTITPGDIITDKKYIGGGAVATLRPRTPGSGYAIGDKSTIESGITFPASGAKTGIIIARLTSQGTGYAIGDTFTIDGGTPGLLASGVVDTVGTHGEVLTCHMTATGYGYTPAPNTNINTTATSGIGTGLQVDFTAEDVGRVDAASITGGHGSGWAINDLFVIVGGDGTARGKVTGLVLAVAISGVNTGAKTFTIDGDHVFDFGGAVTVVVADSTGNDNSYTVTDVSLSGGNTVITVSEAIPDSTADGTICPVGAVASIEVTVPGTTYANGETTTTAVAPSTGAGLSVVITASPAGEILASPALAPAAIGPVAEVTLDTEHGSNYPVMNDAPTVVTDGTGDGALTVDILTVAGSTSKLAVTVSYVVIPVVAV